MSGYGYGRKDSKGPSEHPYQTRRYLPRIVLDSVKNEDDISVVYDEISMSKYEIWTQNYKTTT